MRAVADLIKTEAERLGFVACGLAKAEPIPLELADGVESWISQGYHGSMSYLERNTELRRDPRLLLPEAKSLIMVALNYYPEERPPSHLPQVASYAYGRDYHKVVKKQLDKLLAYIREAIDADVVGRSFADSAPIMERYWAERAGLGWCGKNGLLIIPKYGSFHVLGTLLISLELPPDSPMQNRCGTCRRCLDACPTQAFIAPKLLDARRCISYLTIEQSQEIPPELAERMGERLYGCDVCQEVCPWNRQAVASRVQDFALRSVLRELDCEAIEQMSQETFDRLFAGSPMRRAGLSGLQRTVRAIKYYRTCKN